MKLGLVTDSLADRSLAEAAAVCRGLGLEQVELGCGNWSPAPHVDLKRLTADAGARHRLLDTLGENGLTISALNCSGNPLFPGEKGAGDRAVAEGTFLLAEQLGVETVVMMSGLPGGCPVLPPGSSRPGRRRRRKSSATSGRRPSRCGRRWPPGPGTTG